MSLIEDWLFGDDSRGMGGSGFAQSEGGDSSLASDILSTITNTFVSEAPDFNNQGYLAQKYASDAAKEAAEKELAYLRELMERQDTFQLFRNLGLPVKNAEGFYEDNERADFQINQLRDLVNRDLEDKYKIDPEIDLKPLVKEVDAVDLEGLNTYDVAKSLDEFAVDSAPEAIETEVNKIDFVDPYLAYGPLYSPDAVKTDVNAINPFNPEDPALRFLQDEAMRAVESSAAAQGRLNSGGTLSELQNQAVGIASQYAGDLADIGRVQDAARMGADQQYYTQQFGSRERDNQLNIDRFDNAMAAQQIKDQSQLARDQQYYSQLLGTGQDDYARGMNQLVNLSNAQTAQDDMSLEADLARFNTEQQDLAQRYDQSRYMNTDALARETQLYNEMKPLIDIGLAGATGLTGNTAQFANSGLPIYQQLGEISGGIDYNKKMRNTDLVQGGYNLLKKTLGF